MMEMGVNMDRLDVKNHDIVCDMIGYPPDNTARFKFGDSDYENPPADYFCRDWLSDSFGNLSLELSAKRDIVLTEKGLQVKESGDEDTVRQAISEHVDWLFEEYKNLDNN